MTEAEAHQKLVELDHRYRLILHSTDFIANEIFEDAAQSGARQKFF